MRVAEIITELQALENQNEDINITSTNNDKIVIGNAMPFAWQVKEVARAILETKRLLMDNGIPEFEAQRIAENYIIG